MLISNSILPPVQLIAVLTTATSRCAIRDHGSDDEAGDPIDMRCGDTTKPMGTARKGVAVDRINACHIVLTVHALHRPRLLSVSNCRGSPRVVDVGTLWTARVQRAARIAPERLEFVTFEQIAWQPRCYRVAIEYDAVPGSANTSFDEKERTFCVGEK